MITVKEEYSIMLAEADTILRYVSNDFLQKIPENLKKYIQENKNIEYVFEYDKSKSLVEQNTLEETKDFMTAIYLQYICDEEKREKLTKICKTNDLKYANLSSSVNEEENENEKKLIVVKTKEKWYQKIITLIKRIFKK